MPGKRKTPSKPASAAPAAGSAAAVPGDVADVAPELPPTGPRFIMALEEWLDARDHKNRVGHGTEDHVKAVDRLQAAREVLAEFMK